MKPTLAFLSLFTALSTLLCCALPALFVVLGFGAAFASLIGTIPQLVWFSENKLWLFAGGGLLLILGGILQIRLRGEDCPTDPSLGDACASAKDWFPMIYYASVGIYVVGAFFAFVAPLMF